MKRESLLDSLTDKQQKVFNEEYKNLDTTAMEFFQKYYKDFSEVELLELFASIKMHQTQSKIQNMLWNESERLELYWLRKAGNWVGCDFYRAGVKKGDKEYLDEYKENWKEDEE